MKTAERQGGNRVGALLAGLILAACGTADPVAQPALLQIAEGGEVSGTLRASGTAGQRVTFGLVSPPAHGALRLDVDTGSFVYRAEPYFNGEDQFSFTASAGGQTSAPATVTLQVAAVNDRPAAQGVAPEAAVGGSVLPNGVVELLEDGAFSGRLQALDPDMQVLTFQVDAAPTGGTLELDPATGDFTYRPVAHWSGVDRFTYSATDGGLTSDPATVTLVVAPVNDAPTGQAQSLTVDEDAVLSGRLAASDLDSTVLTYSVASPPTHGSVLLDAATGAFTYRPQPDFSGADSFAFTASDGLATSLPVTVAITVVPVNDAPTANGQAIALDEDGAFAGQVAASDVDGPVLVHAIETPPAHGTLDLDPGTGAFVYRPAPDFFGSDAFSFTATDGLLVSAPVAVNVAVLPVNDAPVALGQAVALDEDAVLSGQLLATDVDGDPLTYAVATQAAHGTVAVDPGTGAFGYYPTPDYNGPDSFTFSASDGGPSAATAVVEFVVRPVNDAPRIGAMGDALIGAQDEVLRIAIPASDPDGDPLQFLIAGPGAASLIVSVDLAGVVTVARAVPNYTSVTAAVNVTVSDGTLSSTTSLGVTALPLPPPAPSALAADPRDGAVDLTWSPSAGATSYVLYWSTDPTAALDQFQRVGDIAAPSYTHSGLTNLTTYRYRVAAAGDGGEGQVSVEAAAEPGPAPSAPEWVVAISGVSEDIVHWAPALNATAHRVYYAGNREQLEGGLPSAPFVEVTGTTVALTPPGQVGSTSYYRVIGIRGAQVGAGSFTASSTSFAMAETPIPGVTPSLWDIDGDGCLDMVGGKGDCQGGFSPESIVQIGVANLGQPGRINRDSRLADFNGDGHVDIFTNVYSRADDAASYALLHLNDGTGHFFTDPGMSAMRLGGYGETVVVADFDNDGDLDIFDPNYWHRDDGGRNFLLVNDGSGGFEERGGEAGVAVLDLGGLPWVPEGAQALDFDRDGWPDIFVASHLLMNNRDGTFRDGAADVSLPAIFDEGASFVDVDQDGDFDLVVNTYVSTILYRNEGGHFGSGELVEDAPRDAGCGLVLCDLNADNFPDVIIPRNDRTTRLGGPEVLLNVGGAFLPSYTGLSRDAYMDVAACGDLDLNGHADVVARWGGYRVMRNRASYVPHFRIRVLGPGGERNQQGRVVDIRPQATPGRTIARVVESGSAYMAQGDYDILVAAPHPGTYAISVYTPGGVIEASTTPASDVTVYADGRVAPGLQ